MTVSTASVAQTNHRKRPRVSSLPTLFSSYATVRGAYGLVAALSLQCSGLRFCDYVLHREKCLHNVRGHKTNLHNGASGGATTRVCGQQDADARSQRLEPRQQLPAAAACSTRAGGSAGGSRSRFSHGGPRAAPESEPSDVLRCCEGSCTRQRPA